MSEQSEPIKHEPNRSPEQLTFAEAGERLNISDTLALTWRRWWRRITGAR
jgi:hypothetical protein